MSILGVGRSHISSERGCDLDQAEPRDWIVQVRLERSLTDKLFGRNKMADNDVVSAHIEALIRESGGALEVEVDRR